MDKLLTERIITKLRSFIATKTVPIVSEGICYNCDLREIPYALRESIFTSWEHWSGDYTYPVPATAYKSWSAEDQYDSGKYLYKGSQLALRLSLAQHVINELEKV